MKIIAVLLAVTAVLTPAVAEGATTQHARHAKVEYIYLQDSDSDGQPMLVASSTISDVHHCHRGTCIARLAGYDKLIWVRR